MKRRAGPDRIEQRLERLRAAARGAGLKLTPQQQEQMREIWAEQAWNAYLEENEGRFKEAAEELGGRIVL